METKLNAELSEPFLTNCVNCHNVLKYFIHSFMLNCYFIICAALGAYLRMVRLRKDWITTVIKVPAVPESSLYFEYNSLK